MSSADPGLELLDHIYKQLQIDSEWAVRSERSFSWWPWNFRQTVTAGPVVEDRGHHGCVFSIATDMATFDKSDQSVLDWVGKGAPFATAAGAFVESQDGEQNGIRLAAKVFVHDGTIGLLKGMLSIVAIMQIFEVIRDLSGLEGSGLRPWITGPGGKVRLKPHDICGAAPEAIQLPVDAPNSSGSEAELERARAHFASERGMEIGKVPETFMASVEIPRFGASGMLVAGQDIHGNYGPGVSIRFYYPLNVTQLQSFQTIPVLLNDISFDAEDGLTLLGSWSLERPPGAPEEAKVLLPTFVSFWPARLFEFNSLINALGYALGQGLSAFDKFAALSQGAPE